MFEFLKDIKELEDVESVEKINKGYSKDEKFKIKLKNKDEYLLLRLSDISLYEQKKEEYEVISKLSTQTKNIVVIGSGDEVLGQFPSQGNILKKDDKVFLLSSNENMILPNFLGWSKADVLNYAELAGLNIETEGNGYVKQQSVPARRIVKKGDNIKIKFS